MTKSSELIPAAYPLNIRRAAHDATEKQVPPTAWVSPEERLLSVFDVLGEWLQQPLLHAGLAYPAHLRDVVSILALEAQLRAIDDFAASCHILMTGAMIAAIEGDPKAASHAKSMAEALIARHRVERSVAVARPVESAEYDTFDNWELLEAEAAGSTIITAINSKPERRELSALSDRYDDGSDYGYAV